MAWGFKEYAEMHGIGYTPPHEKKKKKEDEKRAKLPFTNIYEAGGVSSVVTSSAKTSGGGTYGGRATDAPPQPLPESGMIKRSAGSLGIGLLEGNEGLRDKYNITRQIEKRGGMTVPERAYVPLITPEDSERYEEKLGLKGTLGESIWRGIGAEIPSIIASYGAVGAATKIPRIGKALTGAGKWTETGRRGVAAGAVYTPIAEEDPTMKDYLENMALFGVGDVAFMGAAHGIGKGISKGKEALKGFKRAPKVEQEPLGEISLDYLLGESPAPTREREQLALPAPKEPLALQEGVNWEFHPGADFTIDPAGKAMAKGVAYPPARIPGVDYSGDVGLRGKQRAFIDADKPVPRSDIGDPEYLTGLGKRYNDFIDAEVANMKDEIGGVLRYRPGEDAPLLRASMNPAWYRDFWQKHLRAPREGEWRDLAIRNLIEGNPETGEPANDEFLAILSELSRGQKLPEEWHGLQKGIREMDSMQEPELAPLIDDMQAEQAKVEPYGLTRDMGRLNEAENTFRGRMLDQADFGQYEGVRFKAAANSLDNRELAPTFYSQLQRVIEQKMPNRATPEQIKGILSKGAVKEEELKWADLDGFLEGKQKVTKQEVLDYLKQNDVQVEEVTKEAEWLLERQDPDTGDWDYVGSYPSEQAARNARDSLSEKYPDSEWSIERPVRGGVQYSTYQFPGGENYRELLFTMPGERAYKSAHWDESNVLAHVRFNDRTGANGERVLHVEEIQSDWHQEGRKKGYAETLSGPEYERIRDAAHKAVDENNFLGYSNRVEALAFVRRNPTSFDDVAKQEGVDGAGINALREYARRVDTNTVPDAPFKTTWHEFAMKRMIRYAAENGYDRITWTTGEQQAARYNLSKQISKITAHRIEPDKYSKEIRYNVTADDLGGRNVINRHAVTKDELADFVGKEVAEKIISANKPVVELSGLDLQVGGEGMKGFYDRMIPSWLNKYAKKWGARVEESVIEYPGNGRSYDYEKTTNGTGKYEIFDTNTRQPVDWVSTEQEAINYINKLSKGETYPVHSLPITDAMRESVLYEGQPKFKRTLTPEQKQDLKVLKEVAEERKIGPFRIGKVELAPEAMERPEFKAAGEIAEKLGLRLVTYRGKGAARGAQYGRTIYLSESVTDPLDYVFWHETAHSMATTHRKYYERLLDLCFDHLADAEGVNKHYWQQGYAREERPHEFIADVFAEAVARSGFFARMAEQAPELIKPLLEAIDRLIANVKGKISEDDTIVPFLRDWEALREKIREEVATPYFRDAMGEKQFVETFGKQWQEPAAKAKVETAKADPTNTPEFRKWFGDSKVVDEQGRPLVVYHNTSADFNAFDVSKARQSQDIPGIFFSDSPTEWADMGDRQIQAYLSIKNPYTGDYTTYKGIRGGSTDTAFREIRDALIKDGYDGIITRDGDTTEYIAFSPTQIKSVYNRGTFDPANPDMRFKLGSGGKSPVDDFKAMVQYGVKQIPKGNFAHFSKLIQQQFPDELAGYGSEITERLMKDVWEHSRRLRDTGETVVTMQGQQYPIKRGEAASEGMQGVTAPVRGATMPGALGARDDLLGGLDINPAELSDISGTQAGWRDIWRNMRDVFGEKFPEVKGRILDPLEDAKAAWMDHQRELTDGLYTDIVEGLGIRKGSKESELVQLYGEGGYRHWEAIPRHVARNEQSINHWIAQLEKKHGRGNIEFTGDGAEIVKPFDYDDLVREVGAERAADIVQAENWFRQVYDDLIDQVNAVRQQIYPYAEGRLAEIDAKIQQVKTNKTLFPNAAERNTELDALEAQRETFMRGKVVPKRKDYFRHFREMDGIEGIQNLFDTSAQISPELAGKSMYTRPKSKFHGFMQQRGMGEYKPDAVGGMLDYIPSATYAIHIDPQGAAFRQLERELVDVMGDNTGINKFLEYLKYYADDIQGKTNFFDRNLQFLTDRKLFKGLVQLNNRIKGNVILGNAGTMVSQLFNIPQGIAFAKQHSAPGLTRYLSSAFERHSRPESFMANNPMAQSRFLKERYSGDMYRRFATKAGEKAKNVAVIGMEDVDRFATEFMWNANYEKALHTKGIGDPVRYADHHTRRLVAGRGIGEVPLMQKSKAVQLVAPFQVEVGNLWSVMGDMRRDKDWGAFVVMPLTLWLFNEGAERLRGSGVALDPIQAIGDSVKIAQDDKNKKAYRIMGRMAGEVLSNMPLGQTAAAMAFDENQRRQFFGREDPTRYGSSVLIAKGAQDPIFKMALPFGGLQAEKAIKGIGTLSQGGSYNKKGNLRYPVSADPINAVKGVTFGPGGFRETRGYYEEGGRPLSEKQTAEYERRVGRGVDREQAYGDIQRKRKINSLRNQIRAIRRDKDETQEERARKIESLKKELQKVKAGS